LSKRLESEEVAKGERLSDDVITGKEVRGASMAKQWFAIHTYSGYENKVKQHIEYRAALEEVHGRVSQVIIPAESVIEIKDGKKKNVTRNLMPGYVLIEMEPDEDLFALVRRTAGVSGFVGDGVNAIALTEEEVHRVLELIQDKKDKPKPEIKYRQGEQVKVVSGPFANFIGAVDEIDAEKGKLKVMVLIFGRPTPVELDVLQVESI